MGNAVAAEIEPASPGIAYWADAIEGKLQPDPDAFERMITHPRFRAACEQQLRDTLTLNQNNAKMSRVLIDIQRAILGFFVLYLDARGAVTHATVRDFCVEVGLTSPGRATAILLSLRMAGYIVPDPVQPDRRSRRYVLSREARTYFNTAFRNQMRGLALLEPEALRVAERFDEDAIYKGVVLAICNGLAAASRRGDTSAISLFDQRNAGLGILFRICLSGEPDDDYPPRRPVPLSINALANEFGVSRPHVRKLLRDAEAAGLFRRDEVSSTIVFLEPLREAMIRYHAVVLMGFSHAARSALRATGEMD